MEEELVQDPTSHSSFTSAEQSGFKTEAFFIPINEGGLKRKQSLDPVQKARNADSQRSRLIFGPKSASVRVDRPLRNTINLPRKNQHVDLSNGVGDKLFSNGMPTASGLERMQSPSITNSIFRKTAPTPAPSSMTLKSSGRSLHQRLDAGDADEPFVGTYMTALLQNAERPEVDANTVAANPSQVESRADFVTPSYSRSASVVSSFVGRQDEDISSIMMRGATDLRNAKFEIEEQRREIAFLRSQLGSTKTEKEEALKRLQAVKDAAKLSLEKSSKSVRDLEDAMNELKIKSRSSFEIVDKVQNSLPDVQELRQAVADAMRNVEPLMDENGAHARSSETRHLVDDLQLSFQKSQEVADMLRDKLTSVGSELIDARNRVRELESTQSIDRTALQASSQSLSRAGQRISELSEAMKQQQSEMYDVLSIAAEADTKLRASNERITELTAVLGMKEAKLQELCAVKYRNDTLESLITDKEAKISSLSSIAEELDNLRKLLAEKEQSISILNASMRSREEHVEDIKSRIFHLQTRGDNDTEKIRELTGELQEHKAREAAAEKEAESRDSRYQQLLQKLSSVEQRLEAVKVESDTRNEKLHEANARCQILEERFEDQSITLRVTRESNGDLQERLITTEATHARILESATSDLKCEIALLKEQNAQLQNIASQLDLKIKGQEGELAATLKDHEDKLKNQEELYRARIDAEDKRASRAEYDLAASCAMAQSLQENLATTSAEVQSLRERLDKALLPDPILAEEVTILHARIQNLETERHSLLERAKTIDIRYKRGDLNEEEKSFIKTLVQTSQAIHEQELITKGNDLRRRDNTIKELRAKMHVLEFTLAKHLKAQAQTQAKMPPPAAENRSMINPAAWTSSDPSSSPPTSGPQAPDRDMPKESTNVDNTATAKSTPVPSSLPGRTIPIMPTALVQVTPVQGEIIGEQGKAMQTGLKTPSACRPPAPELAAGPSGNQVAFSRLAMDSSDEIAEFDVPLATVLRKRDVIESPPRAADNVVASKPPLKRLRTSTCKADERMSGAPISKPPVPPSASKTRSRKRR